MAGQETVQLRSNVSPVRTPSRHVSDAFNFLQDPAYRISDVSIEEEHVENSVEAPTEDSEQQTGDKIVSNELAADTDKGKEVNIQDEQESIFTIITSVDDILPPSKCQGGSYVSASKDSKAEMNQDEFTIVTYVDKKIDTDGKLANNISHESSYIHAVYDVESSHNEVDAQIIEYEAQMKENADDVVGTTHMKESSATDTIADTKEDSDEQTCRQNEDKQVQLRKESQVADVDHDIETRKLGVDIKARQSRPGTWRTNQRVVSEAFGFLQDMRVSDELDSDAINYADLEITESSNQYNSNNSPLNSVQETSNLGVEQSRPQIDTHTSGLAANQVKSNGQTPELNGQISTINHVPEHSSQTSKGSENTESGDCESKGISGISGTVSSENDEVGELQEDSGKNVGVKIRSRKKPAKEKDTGDEEGGSSDEDTGVYRESFRKSNWLYVGDNLDLTRGRGQDPSNYVALADLGVPTCETDSIFGDGDELDTPLTTGSQPSHRRNYSTATTTSEKEFQNHYSSVRKRFVQRADSQQEYKRLTTRVYNHVESFTIEKARESGYGIHILDSTPAVISGVDKGSVAEAVGVKEGQVLISINDVNVLDMGHEDIISLVQQDSTRLSLRVGSGDLCSPVDTQAPVLTGYLLKQTTNAIFKSWKKRFFILRGDNCLYYFKNEQESDPLGAIPLNGYTVSRHGDINKCGFKAEKYGCRTSYFMADTRAELASWVAALNEASQRGTSKNDAWMDVTTCNLQLPALGIRKPDCVGYLYTMGRVTRMWRRRYCVLKDACIYYYKNTSSKEAEGVAHLHGYKVSNETVGGKKFSFCLRPPEQQMRVFSFNADNNTDRTRWIESLTSSIQKWVKVD